MDIIPPTLARRSRFRRIFRDQAAWGSVLVSLFAQSTLVVSGPVTARLLGVTGRGELALLSITATLASQVGAIGIPTAVAFTVAAHNIPARTVLRLLSPLWITLCALAGLAGAIAVVVLFSGRGLSTVWLNAALVALLVASSMTWLLILGCLQGEHRFRWLNLLRPVSSTVIALCLLGLLAVRGHANVTAVLGTFSAVNVATCVIGGVVVARGRARDGVPTAVTTRSIVRYGAASFVGANTPLDSLSLDQAAVALFLSREQLGLYVVGSAFTNLPSTILGGLGTIALPRIAAEREPIAQRRLVMKTAIGSILVAAGATAFAELVVAALLPLAFGTAFAGAVPAARVLIVAGFFLSIRRILIVLLQAVGRPGHTGFGEAIGVGVLIALALVLIPFLGLIGASIALVGAAASADVYLWLALSRGKRN